MHETPLKANIQRTLNTFANGELYENATHLLNLLGYQSQRTLNRDANTTEAFLEDFDTDNLINIEKALFHEWHTVDFLFQLTAQYRNHKTHFERERYFSLQLHFTETVCFID